MPYSVNRFQNDFLDNGRFPLTIPDGTINSNATSLRLLGRSTPNYGEYIAEDLVWMLEHFAGKNPPTRPITGQIWFETDGINFRKGKMKLWDGQEWRIVGGVNSGKGLPATGFIGDLFFDEATGKLYYWDGNQWRLVGGSNAGDGPPLNPQELELWWEQRSNRLFAWDTETTDWILVGPGGNHSGPSFPTYTTSLEIGETFYNTTDHKLYAWDGVKWVHIGPGSTIRGPQAPQFPADGDLWYDTSINKAFVYNAKSGTWQNLGGTEFADVPPDFPQPGDLWYDTNDELMKMWDGNSWIAIQGNNPYGPTPPSGPNEGDVWYDTVEGIMKVWDGSEWVAVSGSAPFGNTPPSNPKPGDLWYDLNEEIFRVWNGSEWEAISGSAPTIQPANPVIGDLWYDLVNQRLMVWDGTQWVAISSAPIIEPNNPLTGDFWFDDDNNLLNVRLNDGTWGVIGPDTHYRYFNESDFIEIVGSGATSNQENIDGRMTAIGISVGDKLLRLDHNKNHPFVSATVYDDFRNQVLPDEFYIYDKNRAYLDVSSFTTFDGTNFVLSSVGPGFTDIPDFNAEGNPANTKKWTIVVRR